MNSPSIMGMLLAYANRLKFRNLFLLISALFIIDLLVPDMVPLIDEIILGLLAIILSNWKKEKTQEKPIEKQGTLIDGEIIDEDDNKNTAIN